jgi:hypothetical protein
MKDKLTHEEFFKGLEVEVKRIVEWLNKTDSPTDACESFIFFLVTELGYDHFTTVGILTEVLLEWRNKSIEVLKEESK